jgi:hypothetical protein
MRSLRSLVPSFAPVARFAALACLSISVLSACGPSTTSGANGNAQFSYGSCLFSDCSLGSRGIAAGASTSLEAITKNPVRRASSSDPSILTIGTVSAGGTDTYSIAVGAGKPGTATLTIFDAADKEIDHVSVVVSATKTIAADDGYQNGPTILAGETYPIHATTLGDRGETLAGTGAIQFGYNGALQRDTGFNLCFGDCSAFRAAAPGDGQIVLTAVSATTTATVHAVAVTAIDKVSFAGAALDVAVGAEASVDYTLSAAGKVVYGRALQCDATTPGIATTTDGGGVVLGTATTGKLTVRGSAVGTTTITCTANGKSATLSVHVK